MSVFDVFNLARLRLDADEVLYSPGFSAGPSRARQVVTVHDLLHVSHPRDDSARRHKVYYERILKPVIRRSGHVVTISQTSAQAIAEWVDDDSVDIHNLGIGCSEEFTPAGPTFASDQPYFLFVGNLKPHKDPHLAMEALAATEGVDLRMVVRDANGARRMSAEIGVAERVHVHHDVRDSDLAALYRGSVGLLFTSAWEGFGLPALESLRCGKPVLYSESCKAVGELLSSDTASIALGQEAPPSDWGEIMQSLAETRPTTAAAESWLAQYSWRAVAERVSSLLKGLTAQDRQ